MYDNNAVGEKPPDNDRIDGIDGFDAKASGTNTEITLEDATEGVPHWVGARDRGAGGER